MLFSLPHALLIGRLPDAERRRAENAVVDELALCEREGRAIVVAARQSILRRDEVGFICSRPPLETLELASTPWPAERVTIRVVREEDTTVASTLYFRARLGAEAFVHERSGRSITDCVSFGFVDRTKTLVRGRRLPGTVFADFVRTSDGLWLQYQYCFDEWLATDAVARDGVSRTTLEYCFLGQKLIRAHAVSAAARATVEPNAA